MEGLSRICVKIYADDPGVDDAEVYVPIFHEWIREKPLDLVLFDVSDYAHVPDGPGIVLVTHEAHFAMDRSDGAFGLLAQRRVPVPDASPARAMAVTIRHALQVAGLLERDRRLQGRLRFEAARFRVEFNDRLRAPNTAEAYEAVAPLLLEAVKEVCGDREIRIERVENDPRDRLAADVWIAGAESVAQLLAA